MKTYATKIRPGSNPDSKPCTNEISICSMHGQNGLEIQYDLFQMHFKSFHEMLLQCTLNGFLKNAIKKRGKPVQPPSLFCCRTRIRTRTNRTKTCCATITPYDNQPYVIKGQGYPLKPCKDRKNYSAISK